MAATSHEERQPDMCHPKKMPPAVKYPCKKKKKSKLNLMNALDSN